MNCLLAQKMGVAFTATQIARIDFIPVVEQLYLVNRIVSPYISTTNTILHWLRSKKVRAAALLHNLPGELLDMVVAPGHENDGMYIKDISLPERSVIATVLRENEVFTATGDLQLLSGDRVLVFTHAGWASHLQNHYPEWFIRNDDDCFRSPGAWGIIWEDLSKLDYQHRKLWEYMADVFLFWCKKGIDGFRCDAGYKIPFDAWNYIIARVRLEYPDTIFLLEGLGGDRKITEKLLSDAGMNWAYSEIFQNYDKPSIEKYLPESYYTSNTFGNLIHFAETHDNNRLASTSFEFAKLRVGFCALSCVNGAFGFSNGVEWLATKKIDVHNAYSLNWDADKNLVDWVQRLNAIIEIHPCFHPYAKISFIPEENQNIIIIFRACHESTSQLLIYVNLDLNESFKISNTQKGFDFDLCNSSHDTKVLLPGEIKCLSNEKKWLGKINGILRNPFNNSDINKTINIRKKILETATYFKTEINYDYTLFLQSPFKYFENQIGDNCIVRWNYPDDLKRTVMIPPNHILIVSTDKPFIAEIKDGELTKLKEHSIQLNDNTFISIFLPLSKSIYHKNLILNLTLLKPKNHEFYKSSLLYLSDSNNFCRCSI